VLSAIVFVPATGSISLVSLAARRRPRIRRLAVWQEAGVCERVRRELLRRLDAAGQIDWSAPLPEGRPAAAACERLLVDRGYDHDK
jgi:hypothetical protein